MPAPSTEPSRHLAYDAFVPGATIPFGRKLVTEEEITAWARAFDPQPFHLSEELARDTNVGRLIASGYHTCAILMRMIADEVFGGPHALGAPGVEEVRFLKPVLPGDTLTARVTVKERRVSRSRPGMGLVRNLYELLNGQGEVVLSWDVTQMMRVPAAAPERAP